VEQIGSILNEPTKPETALAEICRTHGITAQTYSRWRRASGRRQGNEAKQRRTLEDENRRLQKFAADHALATAWINPPKLLAPSEDVAQ